MASSVVTSHVSPTVMTSYFDSTSRFISCINSCTRGPLIKPLSPSFESGKPGAFEIRLMTSIRKPSIPLSSHHVIMSYTSRRTFSFSQFRSGCFFEKICRKYSLVVSSYCQADPLKNEPQLFGSVTPLPSESSLPGRQI
ncbi:hypothetical protein D3C81_977940 [compost metagenome]